MKVPKATSTFRETEPAHIKPDDYVKILKLHVSKESIEAAADGKGLFNRSGEEVKDRLLILTANQSCMQCNMSVRLKISYKTYRV
jgi:hypothetical protein